MAGVDISKSPRITSVWIERPGRICLNQFDEKQYILVLYLKQAGHSSAIGGHHHDIPNNSAKQQAHCSRRNSL